MTDAEATAALTSRLEATPGLPPLAPPNVNINRGAVPRVEVVTSRAEPGVLSLRVGTSRRRAALQLVIVTAEGQGEDEALGIADIIADRFPYGLRVGPYTVRQPPAPRQGFPDEGEWRLPLAVEVEGYW